MGSVFFIWRKCKWVKGTRRILPRVMLGATWMLLLLPGCSGGGTGPTGGSGEQVIFQSDRDGDFEIYQMNPDGTHLIRLTSNSVLDAEPAWSSDRSKIIFRSTREGNPQLFEISAAGTRRVTHDAFDDDEPSYSPDGTRILFRSTRNGRFQIMLMNSDGTGEVNLTSHPPFDTAFNADPAFAANGDILFSSNPNPLNGSFRIFRMRPDGSNITPLSAGPADARPAASADGRLIAFESRRDGNAEIYLMPSQGGVPTNLTHNAATDSDPAFSPDGRRLYFASTRTGNFEIFVMGIDGSNPHNLTNDPAVDRLPDAR